MARGYLPYLFFIFLLAVGCKQAKDHTLPMDEEKVINFLVDMHYAKGASTVYPEDKRDSMLSIFVNQIFEIHGLDSARYIELKKSLESDIDKWYDMEIKVQSRLKEIQKKSNINKPKKSS